MHQVRLKASRHGWQSIRTSTSRASRPPATSHGDTPRPHTASRLDHTRHCAHLVSLLLITRVLECARRGLELGKVDGLVLEDLALEGEGHARRVEVDGLTAAQHVPAEPDSHHPSLLERHRLAGFDGDSAAHGTGNLEVELATRIARALARLDVVPLVAHVPVKQRAQRHDHHTHRVVGADAVVVEDTKGEERRLVEAAPVGVVLEGFVPPWVEILLDDLQLGRAWAGKEGEARTEGT